MLLPQQKEMYLPLNFRWPMLMGRETSEASPLMPTSAFRSVAPTSLAAPALSRSGPLPPISSLKDTVNSIARRVDVEQRPSPAISSRHNIHHPEPQVAGQVMRPPLSAGAGPSTLPTGITPPGASPPHPAFPQMPVPLFQPGHLTMHNLLTADKPPYMIQNPNLAARAALLHDLHGRLGLPLHAQYPLGKKLFGCPQCRYITDRKNNLKRHIATMHQECDKVLECCGVVFKNKASLRDHVLIFHSNGYMCRYCGRNFCRKALLKRHLTVHSGQKDFLCEQCDYATSHKSNLERHKRVHDRQALGEDVDDYEDDDDLEIGEIRHGMYTLGTEHHHPHQPINYPAHSLHQHHIGDDLQNTLKQTRHLNPYTSDKVTRSSTMSTCVSNTESNISNSKSTSINQEPQKADTKVDIDIEENDDDGDNGDTDDENEEDQSSVVIDVVSLVEESA